MFQILHNNTIIIHRDTDHLKGLKDINSVFPIQSIWDSGFHGANIGNDDYKYYMGLRNRLKNKNRANLKVPTPSTFLKKFKI